MKHYAGIGSRETPPNILQLMKQLAQKLGREGWILRSGGAKGADTAFEEGALRSNIYYASNATPEAISLASEHHPAWDRCNEYARKLHGRNSMILLGSYLDTPVKFVICWTKDGQATGGTGLGIRLAQARGIPIRNLYFKEVRDSAKEWLQK
jgi:hypothetical protein